MKSRIKLRDRTLENDIKYKGILSYRHLRIIAWICMIITQISTVLALNAKINPGFQHTAEQWQTVFTYFSVLPVPLFLLANFSNILRHKQNYKSIFILYGGGALGLYLLGNLVVFHFGHRFLNSFGVGFSWWDTARLFGQLLPSMGNLGYTFNIFIDLFLCTLLFFFMNYKPKKVFTDKKIIIFRLLFILPVLYEVAGIIIKYFMGVGRLEVPSFAFFLLPSKPPLLFLAFVLIVLALKVGEVTFIKRHQGSTEAYEEHTKTNAHSLKMSIIISIIFLICAIIDFVVIFFIVIKCVQNAALIGTTEEEMALIAYQDINSWLVAGFGGAVSLIFVIPLVLLFSYNKEHKNPKIDTLLPIAGIALIAIVYIEGIFQVIVTNMPFVIERLKEWVNKYFGW